MLGGMGTLFGPVVGAFLLVFIIQVVLGQLLDFHLFATGLLLVVLVLAAPGGVLGLARTYRRHPASEGQLHERRGDPAGRAAVQGVSRPAGHDRIPVCAPSQSITRSDWAERRGQVRRLFHLITGVPPRRPPGRLRSTGSPITGMATNRIAELGIERVFQIARRPGPAPGSKSC